MNRHFSFQKIREFLIAQLDSITDTMDSWFSRESNSQKAQKVIARIEAKQLRLDRDEAKRRASDKSVAGKSKKMSAHPSPKPMVHNQNQPMIIRCPQCGGECKKTTESKSGCGCLIVLLGMGSLLIFGITWIWIPFGVLIMLIGFFLMMSYKGFWTCRSCGSQLPRKVSWFEFVG